jgi:hypothetical protein
MNARQILNNCLQRYRELNFYRDTCTIRSALGVKESFTEYRRPRFFRFSFELSRSWEGEPYLEPPEVGTCVIESTDEGFARKLFSPDGYKSYFDIASWGRDECFEQSWRGRRFIARNHA